MKLRRLSAAIFVLACGLPLAAQAEPAPAGALSLGPAIPVTDLAGERGGNSLTAAQITELSQTASVAGNSVSNSLTGNNLIGHGAFAGSSGIATVIQNSGNNVLIQDAIILNVSLSQ